MSKNSQNLLQSANNEEQLISALGLVTLKTGTGKNIQDLKKAVSGDTVKKAFDELANNINEKFINKLNIMLKQEQDKVVSLQDIIGDTSKGLQKDLADLTAKLDSILPEEAPTHPDIL
ncbi:MULTISPECIES: hypothetical protein [unclassified Wolbachia]|uniref:hypothetical protein n=1 Tax=unclassified Wolbachia TaxID=2640676 RepID=UPI001BD60F4D|nr:MULTISPECIES: hypothetical protein [unclassified Wolbachia]MBS9531459.1 hypothetical protein [Wolbachia endosymbiont of Rhagoletis cerasi]